MKAMLVSPPNYDITMPVLALPCLTAVLREAGHQVVQKDVNIEFFDRALTGKELEKAYEMICERQRSFQFLNSFPANMDRLIARKDILIEEVENAKRNIRKSKQFCTSAQYEESYNLLNECMHFISLAYFCADVSFYSNKSIYSSTSTKQVLNAVKDDICNPFIQYYKNYTIPEIVAENPKVIGISINVSDQIIPGLTLAYMIKQVLKDVHLVVGGSYFTIIENNIKENLLLFSLFDSVILYEGETAITELVNCLEKGAALNQVPNLIYKEGEKIIVNDIVHIEDVDKLPTPCFDGLPLDLYLSPASVLPIYMTRGCYWSKCTFCCFHKTRYTYRKRSVKKVREDIEKLVQKHGHNVFIFSDEAITPQNLEMFSDEVIKSGLNIQWGSFARFEKQYDEKLCKKLANAGCRGLMFGLESANERILGLMDKGTDINTAQNVLSASSNAGIANSVTFFFGFPSETVEEAKETMKFVLDNIKHIRHGIFYRYLLFEKSIIYNNPERFKITKILSSDTEDLASNYEYEVEEGLSQEEAGYIYKLFQQVADELGTPFYKNFNNYIYIMYYNSAQSRELDKQLEDNDQSWERIDAARNKAVEVFNDPEFFNYK